MITVLSLLVCVSLISPVSSIMNPSTPMITEKSVVINISETNAYSKPDGYEESITLRDEPYEIPQYVETEAYYWNLPTYYDVIGERHPVLVECEDWELELMIRTMFLEAGAESDECIRAVTDATFNQLNSGMFGDTLGAVLYRPSNFTETVYRAYDQEPTERVRNIVLDVYYNGISLPARIVYFRNQYFHDTWWGSSPEFTIDNVYFSSSIYIGD